MMASGLYSKYKSDKSFLNRLPLLLEHQEKENTKRKLTLTDVAPAFIFLIEGYFISIIVFMGELFIHPRSKKHQLKEKESRIIKTTYKIISV